MADTGFSLLPARTHTHTQTFSVISCPLTFLTYFLFPLDSAHLFPYLWLTSSASSLTHTNTDSEREGWVYLRWRGDKSRHEEKKNLQGGKFRGRRELKTERKGGVKGGSRKVTRGYFWFPLENPQTHTRVLAESRWDAENIPSSSFPSSPLLTCLHRLHLFSLHCMFAGGCVCVNGFTSPLIYHFFSPILLHSQTWRHMEV